MKMKSKYPMQTGHQVIMVKHNLRSSKINPGQADLIIASS